METKLCSLCDITLNESTDSPEHLILSSLGGKKKIKGFLCRDCNNTTGNDWDKVTAAQLNFLCLFFKIKKDRSRVPAMQLENTAGEVFKFKYDGALERENLVFKRNKVENGLNVQIEARSVDEARKLVSQLAKKLTSVNVEDVMSEAKSELSYSSKPLKARLEFSGPHSIRTAVKSAFCLAVSKGVKPKQCETARSFLLNYEDDDCFAYYNDQDILKNRPSDEMPLHCVAVSNTNKCGLLLAYVEYFGIFRMIIVLSNNYSGDAIHAIYSIDPRTGTKLDLEFELDFTFDDIANVLHGKYVSDQKFLDHASCVIGAQLQKDYAAAEEKAIVNALKQTFKKLGVKEGGYLDPARANEFTDTFLEEFSPYVEHIVGGDNE